MPKDVVPKAEHDALKAEYAAFREKTQKIVAKYKNEPVGLPR
jgi:hypothetical protein